jgi:hypothetical protein
LFDDLIPSHTYLSDPFDGPVSSNDSDDDSVEDIDEQEIYGTSRFAPPPPGLCVTNLLKNSASKQPLANLADLLFPCRSHIFDIGSGASAVPRFTCCCKPTRHPNTTSDVSPFFDQHSSSRNYPHHYSLLPCHCHWARCQGTPGAGASTSVSRRRPRQKGDTQHRRSREQAAWRQGEGCSSPGKWHVDGSAT